MINYLKIPLLVIMLAGGYMTNEVQAGSNLEAPDDVAKVPADAVTTES